MGSKTLYFSTRLLFVAFGRNIAITAGGITSREEEDRLKRGRMEPIRSFLLYPDSKDVLQTPLGKIFF